MIAGPPDLYGLIGMIRLSIAAVHSECYPFALKTKGASHDGSAQFAAATWVSVPLALRFANEEGRGSPSCRGAGLPPAGNRQASEKTVLNALRGIVVTKKEEAKPTVA